MKRKIAILLAAMMAVATMPMSVFANSSNSVDKQITVQQDAFTNYDINPVTGDKIPKAAPVLSIDPSDAISTETSIRLVLTNAEWAGDDSWKGAAGTWADYKTQVNETTDFSTSDNIRILKSAVSSNTIPWSLKVSSGDKKVAILTIAPITADVVKRSDSMGGGKDATYNIPLNAKITAEGDVKVTVDALSTAISNSTTLFATGTSSKGSTVTTVSSIETGRDEVRIQPIAIKETVAGTIKPGRTITVQTNGNFEFKAGQTLRISSDYNIAAPGYKVLDSYTFSKDTITFTVPAGYVAGTGGKLDTLYIGTGTSTSTTTDGLVIVPIDEDVDYGDISIKVKGQDVTTETIKVGERHDYGFDLKTLKDVPTILAGRVEDKFDTSRKTTGAVDVVTETKIDSDQTKAAQVRFAETIKGTWLDTRKLEFTVPEGVKIARAEFDDVKYISSGSVDDYDISKDGRTLSISRAVPSKTDLAEFKMTLYLSSELNFAGDVTLDVKGGGIAAGVVDSVVIAKIAPPITIESASTNVNLGYQKLDTADIKITEAAAGTFLKDKVLYVKLDSIYGKEDLGFADENLDYTIDGELTVKDFKVKNGYIMVTIDRESRTAPSSITFKNVKMGSTRSVPFGSYDILVCGDSFVTNYDDKDTLDYLPIFDDNEGYKFKDYIKVVTETGTLDQVVKVSIGSTSCLINDVASEMDVAPYIQAASGSTMVPLRFVSLALGIDSVESADESSKIQWDPSTKTVTIFYAAGTSITPIQFTANSSKMSVGGTVIPMTSPSGQPVKAEVTDSRMFVPFRALGDALGVKVTWDDATRTAIYNQK